MNLFLVQSLDLFEWTWLAEVQETFIVYRPLYMVQPQNILPRLIAYAVSPIVGPQLAITLL